VRSALVNSSGGSLGPGFRNAASANDFAAGYNVNALVLRVPLTLLGGTGIFDVWETVSLPN